MLGAGGALGEQNESEERSLQQGMLAAGTAHSCALLADGAVRCWGLDDNGQLGDGGTSTDTQSPSSPVALGQPARAITAGVSHTCALLADGAVRCWGLDGSGQLGDGGTSADTQAPSSPVGGVLLPGSVADLSVVMIASATSATVGESLTLTITAANAGFDAAAAAVTVPVPDGLSLVSATPAQGSYSSATGLWHPGPVPAGATATLVLTVKAIAAGASEAVAEIADANAPDPDSTPANDAAGEDDRAATTITVNAAPSGGGGGGEAVAKVAPDALTLTVAPKRDRKAPVRFTARGGLFVSTAILRDVCAGIVTVTAKAGAKTILTQRAPLTLKNGVCSYTGPVVIRNRERIGKARKLAFQAAFAGSDRLEAITSKTRRGRVG